MRLLIIEDSNEKMLEIKSVIDKVDSMAIVDVATDLRAAVLNLENSKYDLIIFDLLLPSLSGSPPQNFGQEILKIVRSSKVNQVSDCIAITAFEELSDQLRDEFTQKGVFILNYSEDFSGWSSTLTVFLNRACAHQRRRFVLVTAVPIEREVYRDINSTVGLSRVENGIDIQPIEISGIHGIVVLLPRMGIVNATAITTLVTERYRPELICMSGICAGIKSETKIGQVLIANPCWEYQVGKETPTGFKIEPYQIPLEESDRLFIKNLIEQECSLDDLYKGIDAKNLTPIEPKIAPLVSGSMVVADEDKVAEIIAQHRKLTGLEMESFGVIQAVKLVDPRIKVFSAKSVVDFADEKKDKKFQRESALVSARFCHMIIEKYFRPD